MTSSGATRYRMTNWSDYAASLKWRGLLSV